MTDPPPFHVGQIVRVKLGRNIDSQPPKRWDGAFCTVASCYILDDEHWVRVDHRDGVHGCTFRADELDLRYRREMR